MKFREVLRSRLTAGVVVGALAVYALGALSANAYYQRRQEKKNSELLIEGFDFNRFRSSDVEWRGPNVGERIDLTRLRARDGRPLSEAVGRRPLMIAAVNPQCAMCRVAADEMIHLRAKLAAMGVEYYTASFSRVDSPPAFFDYAASLRVGAPSFLWDAGAGAPPEALVVMGTPSHLLLNPDGTVIRVWPGSHQDVSLRQRMARQIIADAQVALDTLDALSAQGLAANREESQVKE
jgi:hypothetical protein